MDGSRRVVGVYEAEGLGAQGEYVMRPLFEFKFQGEDPGTGRIRGALVPTGKAPTFAADLQARGCRLPASTSASGAGVSQWKTTGAA